ncbi:MAG: sialidase family protein [Lysobacterales bacterium]
MLVAAFRPNFMVTRSQDAGQSWQSTVGLPWWTVMDLVPEQTVFDANRPGRVYTATSTNVVDLGNPATGEPQASGVFRSDDGGATWLPASQGLPPHAVETGGFESIYSVAVDRSTADRVWATARSESGESRVYRSDDGAANWYPCGRAAGASFLDQIAQDPDRPSRIVVADRGISTLAGTRFDAGVSRSGGVWISDNRCLTWQRLGAPLAAGVMGVTIANGKAYAATDEGTQIVTIPAEQDGVIFLSNFE